MAITKIAFLAVSLFIIAIHSTAQNKNDKEAVFIKVELKANTNPYAWQVHIKKSTTLPDSVVKHIPGGTYEVIVQFIVDPDGSIRKVEAKNDPGYGLSKKAVEIIKSYKGEWSAASQCGRLVKSYIDQPIRFVIAK